MARGTASAARTTSRGRIDKRQAILDAAFTVFARQGYSQTCVQEIAEEAGVAKLTVYNHLSDKENLFRQAVEAAADAVAAEGLAVVERLREPGADLPAATADLARRMLQVVTGKRALALRWLTYAQVARFPDLVESVQRRTSTRITEALADRFARLSLSGELRRCDPAQAAEQFMALLTGPVEARSRLGTRRLPASETRAVAAAAVDTFLRAYATGEAGETG
ncbi:TetR/AcrR family transcriptional regulator [Saccharopolyspora erythraea]|uniref:TetR/AcrR family transcriptional regulator n=1 Tax=Saccharopolyspora erythraea TaxID=1836 RepID=UPI001BA78DE9|nr:TetR/AcrR family transcriptional regulator [Saccharopolyspora erythraea]QUH00920.1 TetR/AcrR family transcriptional regulator [Saccharopolyspora erythraea]